MHVFSTFFNNKSKTCSIKFLFMYFFTRQAQKLAIYCDFNLISHLLVKKDLFSNTGCTIKVTTGNCGNIIDFFIFFFWLEKAQSEMEKMIASEALEVSA